MPPIQSTVCIIDPDTDHREECKDSVKKWGFQVQTYSSGKGYLATQAGARPACVLIEHRLGGMSGLELLEVLSEHWDALPTIVLTAEADVTLAVDYLRAGAVDFLQKPYSNTRLRQAIDTAIEKDVEQLARMKRYRELKAAHDTLTERELWVLGCVLEGKLKNTAMANQFGCSTRTIESTRAKIYEKFGVDTAAAVASKATELRMLAEFYAPKGDPPAEGREPPTFLSGSHFGAFNIERVHSYWR